MKVTKFFSTDSAKAVKATGFGYLNAINYMAPHETAGVGNMCPDSTAGCRDLCLGFYSGQAAMVSDLENTVRDKLDAQLPLLNVSANDLLGDPMGGNNFDFFQNWANQLTPHPQPALTPT